MNLIELGITIRNKALSFLKNIKINLLTALIIVAVVAVAIKVFLFYRLMVVNANFLLVWFITCVIIALLFLSFRNKYIPATIFVLITILMFMDAVYSSFFNRYLSINMIGAAGLLGDVTESIKEILKPKFFILFADLIPVFAAVMLGRHRLAKGRNRTSALVAVLVILSMLALNIPGVSLITSINHQELFSFHAQDFASTLQDSGTSVAAASSAFEVASGAYEEDKNGPQFGIAKNRNLIVIQVESFQNFIIGATYNGQELTPNLNRLIEGDTIYFEHYFQQVGSGNTSDAEYASQNSLFGTATSYTYELFGATNYFRGLPVQLKEQGYETAVFHAYKKDFWSRNIAYPNQGFNRFYSQDDFELGEIIGMGLNDVSFFEQTANYLSTMNQPFYSFLITLSNHFPFVMPAADQEIKLLDHDKGTLFGSYLNSVHYTDKAIGLLIEDLKKKNLYQDSVIAIYGDHFGLTPNDPDIQQSVSRYLGKVYGYETQLNIPLIIHIPGEDINRTVSTTGGQMDFLPTMAYLMGFDQLSTIYLGQNLLTADYGFVAEQCYMPKGSFIMDNTIYVMSKDGVFENGTAYDIETGVTRPIDACKEGHLKSLAVINNSEYYLKNDVLRSVYLDHQEGDELTASSKSIYQPSVLAMAGAPDKDLVGTNTLEALNQSYDYGYRYLTVKLNWTLDGRTVLLDKWDSLASTFEQSNGQMTLDQFIDIPRKDGLTSMQFADLAVWMKEHQEAYLIIQLDENMQYLLQAIQKDYPELLFRIIPEVTNMNQFLDGNFIAYPNILFSVESNNYTQKEIATFVELCGIWGVKLPAGETENYSNLLKSNIFVYMELDEIKELSKYKKAGVDGFITKGMEGFLQE